MSSDHRATSLDDFRGLGGNSQDSDPEDEWISTAVDGRADDCRRCGAIVTRKFALVMGDNDNHVWACPACSMGVELINGAAADPDFDHARNHGGESR